MDLGRFREELKRFDKTLDIEWNGPKGRYEIVGYDLKNHRYLIKKIPLGQLSKLGLHTLHELYDCSPIKQGGAKALNRRIDELIEQEEKAEQKLMQENIESRLEDAWLHLQHKNGYRVSMHIPQTNDTVVITDRRRVSA